MYIWFLYRTLFTTHIHKKSKKLKFFVILCTMFEINYAFRFLLSFSQNVFDKYLVSIKFNTKNFLNLVTSKIFLRSKKKFLLKLFWYFWVLFFWTSKKVFEITNFKKILVLNFIDTKYLSKKFGRKRVKSGTHN